MTDKPKMYCIHCGKEIPAGVRFCPFCGTEQTNVSNMATETTPVETDHRNAPHSDKPDKPNMLTALKLSMRDLFTISKRLDRADFWWLYLDIFIIGVILNLCLSPVLKQMAYSANIIWPVILFLLAIIYALTTIGLFTAEIRRLHDTNRSGHFLWLLLIPIVGSIVVIVLLAQKSNAAGTRFESATPHKPWVKQWWTWVILALVTIVLTITFGYSARVIADSELSSYNDTTSTSSNSEDSSTSDDTDTDSDSDSTSTDSIDLDDSTIDIADKQSYSLNYSETWSESTFSIDKVTVYQTDGEYSEGSGHDKTSFNGIVKVHMAIDAGRDIDAYPTQATLSTSDGQQVDADMSDSDDFDGELDSGTQTDGNVYFLLPKLDDVSDLTSIRLKWSADYDTDDMDDDDAYKDFDATLQLNQ